MTTRNKVVPKKTETTEPAEKKILVKFYVSPADHRRLKAVVAISGLTIEQFCQKLVLEKLRAVTDQIDLFKETGGPPRRS